MPLDCRRAKRASRSSMVMFGILRQMNRSAEIVGGGFAGLAAACALAQRGWRVRLHERGDRLRTAGAGINVYENGLRVLDALGALEDTIRGGARAEIILNSEGIAATAAGGLQLANGERLKADLIVAADGVNSRIRDGLGLVSERRYL